MEKRYDINELGLLGGLLAWTDRHQTATNVILILEAIALFWAVLTYNFTTNF
jgi:hypothetical protein